MTTSKIRNLLFLFPLAMYFFFAGCGSKPDAIGPTETAEAFLKALKFGDYGKAKSYCTPETTKNLDKMESMANLGTSPMVKEFTIINSLEDGDYATVTYDQGEVTGKTLQLRKDSDKWLVIMNKADMHGTTTPLEEKQIEAKHEELYTDEINTEEFDAEIKHIEQDLREYKADLENSDLALEEKERMLSEKQQQLLEKQRKIDQLVSMDKLTKIQAERLRGKVEQLENTIKKYSKEIEAQRAELEQQGQR